MKKIMEWFLTDYPKRFLKCYITFYIIVFGILAWILVL